MSTFIVPICGFSWNCTDCGAYDDTALSYSDAEALTEAHKDGCTGAKS